MRATSGELGLGASSAGRWRGRGLGALLAAAAFPSMLVALFFLRWPELMALALLFGIAVAAAVLARARNVDKLTLLILANFAYWVTSGLLTGGLHLADFGSTLFYQGEGRVFILYAPLLLSGVYRIGRDDLELLFATAKWLAIATAFLFLIWLVAHPAILSAPTHRHFWGFSTSHHGSGAFAGALATFFVIRGALTKDRRLLILGVLPLFAVAASASRTSMVGLAGAMLWLVLHNAFRRRAPVVLAFVAIVVAFSFYLTPDSWSRVQRLFSEQTLHAVVETAEVSNWEPGQDKSEEMQGTGEYNALVRVLHWGFSVRRIYDSPLVGIGFTRYNDLGLQYAGVKHVVYMAVGARERQISPATAHNSYLYVMTELGIIGLVAMLEIWWTLYRRFRNAARLETMLGHGRLAALYASCQGLIVFLFAMGFSGHSLGSPALGMTAAVLVAATNSFLRSRNRTRVSAEAPRPAGVGSV